MAAAVCSASPSYDMVVSLSTLATQAVMRANKRALPMSRASARCIQLRSCLAPCATQRPTSRASDESGIQRSLTLRHRSNSAGKHARSWVLNCLKQTARTSARCPPPQTCCSPAGSSASGFLRIPTSLLPHSPWSTIAARQACQSSPTSRQWQSSAQPSVSARTTTPWASLPAPSRNSSSAEQGRQTSRARTSFQLACN